MNREAQARVRIDSSAQEWAVSQLETRARLELGARDCRR